MRILEATIAVLIVSTVLVVIYSGQPKRGDNFNDITAFQKQMMMDISSNFTLRTLVINAVNEESTSNAEYFLVKDYVNSKIPSYLNFSLRICDMTSSDPCKNNDFITTVDKDVFADEVIISAEITEYSPKKVKLFVWRK